jgi:hypothetical protein
LADVSIPHSVKSSSSSAEPNKRAVVLYGLFQRLDFSEPLKSFFDYRLTHSPAQVTHP